MITYIMKNKSSPEITNTLEDKLIHFTQWVGSVQSVIVHTIIFTTAFVLAAFEIFPFDKILLVLTTLVSLEAIYLSIFIQMSVNRNTKAIEVVEHEIEEISEDLEDLADDVEEVAKDIDEIQEDVEEITEDIENIEKDIDEIQEDVEEVAKDIDEIQEDVEEITEDIEDLAEDSAATTQPKP